MSGNVMQVGELENVGGTDRLSSPSPTKGLNGDAAHNGEDLADMEPIQRLQLELERTRLQTQIHMGIEEGN